MQFIAPIPFQDALDKLGQRTLIGSGLDSEQWSRVPLALRERAFFSSQVESTRFLQRSRDSIADFLQGAREEITLPDGTKTTALKTGSRADFIKQLQDFAIGEGMGPLDPAHEGTIRDIRTEKRLGLIFDTQVRQAQDYGNWKQGQDPDILNAFPAQRFMREREVKEPRDIHHLHEGEVQLKTDLAFWKALNLDFHVPWGPWAWGCGHDVEDVDRAEAERLGLLQTDQQIQPVDQKFNEDLQASTQNLDPDMIKDLQEAFGDQVEIKDGTARWTGQPKSSVPSLPSVPFPPEPIPPRQNPVSSKMVIQVAQKSKPAVERALEAIDRSHDDGTLTPLPIDNRIKRGSQGTYFGHRIAVKREAIHAELTVAHEVGHWIDEMALPGHGFSSDHHPALETWREAIQRSSAYQSLKAGKPNSKYRRYALTWRELWARAYAQFIAHRSQDSVMLAQVRKVIEGKTLYWIDLQWAEEDFAPIAAEIETLFKNQGWI